MTPEVLSALAETVRRRGIECSMADVRLVKVMNDGLVAIVYDGDYALWSRVKLRKANKCEISGRTLMPGERAFAPIGNQMYRSRRISAEIMEASIKQWKERWRVIVTHKPEEAGMAEKKVLALDSYDLAESNLHPINPFDAMFQPGERVRVVEGEYEGQEGEVQAVGYAGGFYDAIVADVLCDGYDEADRIPQENLEGA